MTAKILGPVGLKAFTDRGICPETVVRFGIYTVSRSGKNVAVVPDENGNIIAFPFEERGIVVAEKYRAPDKRFWQRVGGRRTFWNADALDDPGLESGQYSLVITEGEIDALTAIDCGFPLSVSVPDGAPGVPDGEQPDELKPIDPASEHSGKFEFLWNNRERLARVKRFTLAVDNDAPGRRLAAELVRRLSAARCQFVTYPEGCKDLNDVLSLHGPERVAAVLDGAKRYPVRGLYRFSEYPKTEALCTYSTGWGTLDRHLQVFPGEFMVVTGIPGHGKSTLVLNLLVNLAKQYGWISAIFSPEMPTVPQLRDKLRRIVVGCPLSEIEYCALSDADRWLEHHFVFIDADPTGRQDEDFDLDWLLDRATDAVLRDGIKVLVIDPWNEIEHARKRDETMPEYIGRSIRALKRFARLYDVMVIVVAHPTKDVGRDGQSRAPTLYDIDGAAHWFNKPDHGLIIDRPDPNVDEAEIRVAKVRFDETGKKGMVRMRFDRLSARFILLNETASATVSI